MRTATASTLRSHRARAQKSVRGFTMIEIAISLAVIGFALVAIVGVLPMGMDVQKENREETIVNQDATMFMEAIRGGAQGLDELTNYVMAITNFVTEYHSVGKPVVQVRGYTANDSTVTPKFPLITGQRIIGLLSTPKYIPFSTGKDTGFVSNYVVGYFRCLSGDVSDKYPQTNQVMRDMAFSYRLVPEIVPYSAYDPSWVNFNDPAIRGNTNEILSRSNYWTYVRNLQTNLHEVRLLFRWPVLPNGKTGNGRQVYRTTASGSFLQTNAFGFPRQPAYSLYFLQSKTYVKAP